MNLLRIARRISDRYAGSGMNLIRDLGVFEKNMEPDIKRALEKLVDEGLPIKDACIKIMQSMGGAAQKIWKDAAPWDSLGNFSSAKTIQEGVWEIEADLHEILHEGIDPGRTLSKNHADINPLQDLLNEVFIGTIGAKPPNVGVDSMRTKGMPEDMTFDQWLKLCEASIGSAPKEIIPTLKKLAKFLRRKMSSELQTKPWLNYYGKDYERVKSLMEEALKEWEDPDINALTADVEKNLKLYISLVTKRLRAF